MAEAHRWTFVLAFAFGTAAVGSAARASDLQALQGAWTTDAAACASTFTSAGGGPAFRADADLFASAFIVSGKRIRTPLASCGIRSIRRDGDWLELRLQCENAVSTAPVVARFSLVERGLVVRRLGKKTQGPAPRGTAFVRCDGTVQ